jgi:hypothetical protein
MASPLMTDATPIDLALGREGASPEGLDTNPVRLHIHLRYRAMGRR